MTNILEVFLYHRTAAEACEESLVELIDYCYRKFVALTGQLESMTEEERNKPQESSAKDMLAMDPVKDLER